ncbi:MAG: HTH domain-containing protein [Deltaproteobacteria bacterium]|nr:HTH domain-containing protein [Deltaproteobacteria bacterium]
MPPNKVQEEELEAMRKALRVPRTVPQLVKILGVTRRTVYNHLARLAAAGDNVIRVGITRPTKYQIQNLEKSGPPKNTK